jgi:DNA-binding CsgD family transcriptional regulator
MEHLLFFSYVLLFSTGFAGLAALVFLAIREGGKAVGYFAAIQVLYLTGLGAQAVQFYYENIAGNGHGAFFRDFGVPYLLLGVSMTAIYALAFAALRAQGFARRNRRLGKILARGAEAFLAATSVLMAAGTALAGVRRYAGLDVPELSSMLGFLSYGPVAIALLATGLVLLTGPLGGERKAYRTLLRAYGLSLVAFFPLTIAEALLEDLSPFKPLSLDYLFFLGWNCSAIAAFLVSIAPSKEAPPVVDAVPDAFAERFALSPREREMVLLIARGLSNKEIGAELGIAMTTARTHIYNLFQKVGARSRIELLRKLRSEESGR